LLAAQLRASTPTFEIALNTPGGVSFPQGEARIGLGRQLDHVAPSGGFEIGQARLDFEIFPITAERGGGDHAPV
jgi:hypothetical protein